MSLLGKVYLGVSLALFFIGVIWASNTLQSNSAWVGIVLAVPRLDLIEPLPRVRYEVNLAVLLGGWVVAVGLLAVLAMRAPFRIRGAALVQRRIRELEREVLELRTLPLRQQEEDEILAAEAHIEAGTKKVMTEKLQREQAQQRSARDDLRSARDDLRSARDDLRSTRDDPRSVRDDLRSARDDLRGSREDLRGARDDLRGPRDEPRGGKDREPPPSRPHGGSGT